MMSPSHSAMSDRRALDRRDGWVGTGGVRPTKGAGQAISFGAAAIAFLTGVLICVAGLRAFDWNPSVFLHLGVDDRATVDFARDRLGSVVVFPGLGHDGKFFFVQATDLWLRDSEQFAELLDRPAYRAQRFLYPAVGSLGSSFGPWGIVWALLLINVVWLGLGTWATAELGRQLEISPWWGLAFGLNPGMLSELLIDGSGLMAWGLGVAGLLALTRRRHGKAALYFAGAALARETMLLAALGVALYLWWRESKPALHLVVVPATAVATWGFYVRWRLGLSPSAFDLQSVGAPFAGFSQAWRSWPAAPLSLLMGLASALLVIMVLYQAVAKASLLVWSGVGFALIAPFLASAVWLNIFDISRALAPLYTTFALAAARRPAASDMGGWISAP
jgi:hypothetical protein